MKIKTYNFHHWTNEIKNNHTWISRKIFVFYEKWKTKNRVVLDVRSAVHLEAFWIKQGVLFLHVCNVLGVCRGVHLRSHASYVEAWIRNINEIWMSVSLSILKYRTSKIAENRTNAKKMNVFSMLFFCPNWKYTKAVLITIHKN